MKTKVLELKKDQSLCVSICSNKLRNCIKVMTGLDVSMVRYEPHCGEEKQEYLATFIRHGRPLNYEYCVLKVLVHPCGFYMLCKDVEMKKANSATPCIDLKLKHVVAVSTDKSTILQRYEKVVEASRDKSKSTQKSFYGCHAKSVEPVSYDPNCHSSVLCSFSGCHGISR